MNQVPFMVEKATGFCWRVGLTCLARRNYVEHHQEARTNKNDQFYIPNYEQMSSSVGR